MPFAYFERLSRRQQGIYLRSEQITQVALPGAPALRPLVTELRAALESDDRALTESAAQLLAGVDPGRALSGTQRRQPPGPANCAGSGPWECPQCSSWTWSWSWS